MKNPSDESLRDFFIFGQLQTFAGKLNSNEIKKKFY